MKQPSLLARIEQGRAIVKKEAIRMVKENVPEMIEAVDSFFLKSFHAKKEVDNGQN